MKQPGFLDYPQVWSAIGSLALALIIVIGRTLHGTPYELQDIGGIAGAGVMAWLFASARWFLLWPLD